MTDILSPLRTVFNSHIHFSDSRVGPAFYSCIELLFNDLEIGLYRPSDRCNAGLENLTTLLADLAEESEHEIMSKDEEELVKEEEVEEVEEEEIVLLDDDDEEPEEEELNLEEEG